LGDTPPRGYGLAFASPLLAAGAAVDVSTAKGIKEMTEGTPKIYVADLAAYNSGILHGVWIDATEDLDSIQEAIQTMLAASPEPIAEEYAIHDYENFQGYSVGEYAQIRELHEIACFIAEHGTLGGKLLDHFSGDVTQARQAIEEDYCGQYTSLADFAEEITEETTTIPETLRYYIDYKAMARDMDYNGDVFTIETGFEEVHIFWNR
jgi:antirestriction protein